MRGLDGEEQERRQGIRGLFTPHLERFPLLAVGHVRPVHERTRVMLHRDTRSVSSLCPIVYIIRHRESAHVEKARKKVQDRKIASYLFPPLLPFFVHCRVILYDVGKIR